MVKRTIKSFINLPGAQPTIDQNSDCKRSKQDIEGMNPGKHSGKMSPT